MHTHVCMQVLCDIRKNVGRACLFSISADFIIAGKQYVANS